jgi:acetyltransferase-like isoleucine patch superfamily enzyme
MTGENRGSRIHPTAEVSPDAVIGRGTQIWHFVQVREGAVVGEECIFGKGVYVDAGVRIGNRVKLQNRVSVFHGATLEDGVFMGPHSQIANDRIPRAINPDGTLKRDEDWQVGPVGVRYGASIGAGAVVLPDVEIGRWAMVGAGAVVTKDVPPHGLVVGVPARLVGYVCACGERLNEKNGVYTCPACGRRYALEDGILQEIR